MASSSIGQPPEELARDLAACGLVDDGLAHANTVSALPRDPGAYALLIGLRETLPLGLDKLGAATLEAGWYVYAGSAYGPGGLRARITRHMTMSKRQRPHWHVDRLTAHARPFAFAIPGGNECRIVSALMRHDAFGTALPGFGSSDCAACESHLLVWNGGREDCPV